MTPSFCGAVAGAIDQLVVAGHSATAASPPPAALARLRARPGFLTSIGTVLLSRPIRRSDMPLVFPYIPVAPIDEMIDAFVADGLLTSAGEGMVGLTPVGRGFAAAIVEWQDHSIETLWSGAPAVALVRETCTDLVSRSPEPPTTPSAFDLFAGAIVRPSVAATALRAITAMRYWRADAHRAALDAAGLGPVEAHALNRLWDLDRAVERVGQGLEAPGRRGTAVLEERGLAANGAISDAGRALRESVEADTDRRTDPLYASLSDGDRAALLASLRELVEIADAAMPAPTA